jgi:CubicO group peptidase (beta-lactamase class C family)
MQWNQPLRAAFSFVAGFLACISASSAQDDLSRMEEVIRSYVSSNQFMGAILVARNDQILLDKGYGYANLEWQVPNSPDTKFRLGSITKQFTAACVLPLGPGE